MDPQLKFGIEEEYFITDLSTRRMSAQPPGAVIEACQAALGPCFAYEMFQGQIEVASPVFTRIPEATQYLATVRRTLRQILEPYGLGLLSVGSHPLADWRLQQPTRQDHFLQLFEDYQRVARRSLLSGLHVHVEVPGHLDRTRWVCSASAGRRGPWQRPALAIGFSSPISPTPSRRSRGCRAGNALLDG
jgi:carboxylate-amine ligase